jgi:hypothetical protein
MEKPPLYKEPSFASSIKSRLVDMATDYVKKNFENTKKDVLKYVERTIEKKIKKEVRKYTYTGVAISLFILSLLFIVYGIIGVLMYMFELPSFVTNIIFGAILLIVGLIVYLLR